MYLDYKRDMYPFADYERRRVLGLPRALRYYIETGNSGDRFSRRRYAKSDLQNKNRYFDMLKGGVIVSGAIVLASLLKKRKANSEEKVSLFKKLFNKVLGNVKKPGKINPDGGSVAKAGIIGKLKNVFSNFGSDKNT